VTRVITLRKLNLLIALAAVAGLAGLAVLMSGGRRTEGWVLRGKELRIYGADYTLARLAQEVADPQILNYDPRTREATAKASLIVYGSLQIGQPDDPKHLETLYLDTIMCGDLRIEVPRGGELRVHNAVLETVKQILTTEQCSQGYALLVDGTLRAANSKFLYMSGSRTETARDRAQVDLDNVDFGLCDGCAFRTLGLDGERVSIRGSRFKCAGQFGFFIRDSGGKPIVLRDCELYGQLADLALSGRRPAAELIDCLFRKDKIQFMGNSGRAAVRWTVTAKAVERGTARPLAGIEIAATRLGPGPDETVTGRTGPDGTCPLVLTEYVATPDLPKPAMGLNTVTPHRIEARSPSGEPLAPPILYEARGPRGTVTLELPPARP